MAGIGLPFQDPGAKAMIGKGPELEKAEGSDCDPAFFGNPIIWQSFLQQSFRSAARRLLEPVGFPAQDS